MTQRPPEPAFPTLETRRFRLREIVAEDIQAIFRGLSHPQVIRYYGVSYATLETTRLQMDWYRDLVREHGGIWWGICRAENPAELFGACGFNAWAHEHQRAELGYWLMPEHWRDGVMRECLEAALEHGFTVMDLHRIEAVVDSENLASSALLRRLGFVHEGVRRECEQQDGRFISLDCFGLLRGEALAR